MTTAPIFALSSIQLNDLDFERRIRANDKCCPNSSGEQEQPADLVRYRLLRLLVNHLVWE